MRFSESRHFKAYSDCEHCGGLGKVDVLQAQFNVRALDFDIITDNLCPYCLRQSKEDFESYMEDR